MKESFYTVTASIEKIDGVRRRATMAVGPPLDLGVHGPVKEHYRLQDAPDLPLAVDYVVAATGG